MIDAEGVEVLFHPLHALLEPVGKRDLMTLLPARLLLMPVVGGEAPVLSIYREGIRRCPCRTVHIEEFRMGSRLHTVTIHADGHIPLQDDTLGTGIVGSSQQLHMQLILDIVDQLSLILTAQPLGIRHEP